MRSISFFFFIAPRGRREPSFCLFYRFGRQPLTLVSLKACFESVYVLLLLFFFSIFFYSLLTLASLLCLFLLFYGLPFCPPPHAQQDLYENTLSTLVYITAWYRQIRFISLYYHVPSSSTLQHQILGTCLHVIVISIIPTVAAYWVCTQCARVMELARGGFGL